MANKSPFSIHLFKPGSQRRDWSLCREVCDQRSQRAQNRFVGRRSPELFDRVYSGRFSTSVQITSPQAALESLVPQLRNKVDVVILLASCEFDETKRMVQRFPESIWLSSVAWKSRKGMARKTFWSGSRHFNIPGRDTGAYGDFPRIFLSTTKNERENHRHGHLYFSGRNHSSSD